MAVQDYWSDSADDRQYPTEQPPQPVGPYPPPAETPAQPMAQPGSLIAREIIETLLLTLLIFWVVNTITGRFRIEGSSMLPTMHEGEYVLINKLSYFLDQPERGDIIVLNYPRDPSRDFIKRIIGTPGDNIEVKDQTVYINDVALTEPYINAAPNYKGSWTVPADQFFVLGDNRNNSSDSHNWGFVARDEIVGKGWVVYWPVTDMQRIPHYAHTLEG
jgi:signal peptidase I